VTYLLIAKMAEFRSEQQINLKAGSFHKDNIPKNLGKL
jgi:hypothetical protein